MPPLSMKLWSLEGGHRGCCWRRTREAAEWVKVRPTVNSLRCPCFGYDASEQSIRSRRRQAATPSRANFRGVLTGVLFPLRRSRGLISICPTKSEVSLNAAPPEVPSTMLPSRKPWMCLSPTLLRLSHKILRCRYLAMHISTYLLHCCPSLPFQSPQVFTPFVALLQPRRGCRYPTTLHSTSICKSSSSYHIGCPTATLLPVRRLLAIIGQVNQQA